MKVLAFVALSCAVTLAPMARADPSSPTAKAEMDKVAQWVGRWKGGGWIDTPSGRHESLSEETIEMRLDGQEREMAQGVFKLLMGKKEAEGRRAWMEEKGHLIEADL